MATLPFPPRAAVVRLAAPALAAVIGLVSTAAAFRYVDEVVRGQQRMRFQDVTDAASARVVARMVAYATMLRAARGLFDAQGAVPDRGAFARFVASLELAREVPGIQGIGWARALAPGEVAAHEAAERAAGRPGYRVWPEGRRGTMSAIDLLEPADWRNERAIGFDMFSEPTRRAAMERARDTGEVAASGRVELVQEAGEVRQAGFLLYLPVYARPPASLEERRALLRGWVYAPFRAADLLEGILGPAELATVGLAAFDGADATPGGLLFDGTAGEARGDLVTVDHVEIAGRPWTLRYVAGAAFTSPAERALPLAVLAAGLVLAAIVTWATSRDARARDRAEQAARRSAFLAEAGKVLASSLEYRRTLADVARLAAERVAAACRVVVEEADAPIRVEARRAGAPAPAGPPDLAVPIAARGEQLGTIELWHAPGATAPAEDRILAEDLARLAAAAVDTARLYRRARDAVQQRDDFLSIASHELKTPLTSLALQSESLRVSARRGDAEGVSRKVEVVRRNVDRLGRLVASLLDLSRIQAGRLDLELEDVDLSKVATEVVARFEEEAARTGSPLSLSTAGAVVGRWDRTRLDQVLTNLVANAVKYGAGKPVEVAVAADAGRATVTVRDRGIGISEPDQRRIFERFERAVSERNYGGFGLGLWIVRQNVEALGGTVRVESVPGEGATFTIELPRGAAEAPAPGERAGAPAQHHV